MREGARERERERAIEMERDVEKIQLLSVRNAGLTSKALERGMERRSNC